MTKKIGAAIHMQENAHKSAEVRLTINSLMALSRKQLTVRATRQTPHGASRLVHAMSASVGKKPACPISAYIL